MFDNLLKSPEQPIQQPEETEKNSQNLNDQNNISKKTVLNTKPDIQNVNRQDTNPKNTNKQNIKENDRIDALDDNEKAPVVKSNGAPVVKINVPNTNPTSSEVKGKIRIKNFMMCPEKPIVGKEICFRMDAESNDSKTHVIGSIKIEVVNAEETNKVLFEYEKL